MKVGILGSGDVGQALGAGFAARGHDVMIGTRDPGGARIEEWSKKSGSRASAGTFNEAARFGEIAVLATLWSGTENAIKLADPGALAGKVVIDTTNPLVFSPGVPPRLALGHEDSGGEQVQRWLAGAQVVKAFNTVGHAHMFQPRFPGGPPDMIICGNSEGAKKTVAGICETFGWPVVDIGGIEAARLLEPLAMIWITHYLRTGSGEHAFKLLRR